jgi:hypothetical protein
MCCLYPVHMFMMCNCSWYKYVKWMFGLFFKNDGRTLCDNDNDDNRKMMMCFNDICFNKR